MARIGLLHQVTLAVIEIEGGDFAGFDHLAGRAQGEPVREVGRRGRPAVHRHDHGLAVDGLDLEPGAGAIADGGGPVVGHEQIQIAIAVPIHQLDLPAAAREEVCQTLLANPNVRIERIVSRGQSSPAGFWYDQEMDEWVLLAQGAARLRFADGAVVEMRPGSFVNIPAHRRHRVEWTDVDQVIFASVAHSGPDAFYLPRHVGLYAGVPQSVPALLVQRICGSGFEALISGAEQIALAGLVGKGNVAGAAGRKRQAERDSGSRNACHEAGANGHGSSSLRDGGYQRRMPLICSTASPTKTACAPATETCSLVHVRFVMRGAVALRRASRARNEGRSLSQAA